MSPATGPGFDRLRARTPPRPISLVGDVQPAPRRAPSALFSAATAAASDVPPPAGHAPPPAGQVEPAPSGGLRLGLDCGSCGALTPLTASRAVVALATGVHLPVLALAGVGNTSWVRCPACERRAWGRLTVGWG